MRREEPGRASILTWVGLALLFAAGALTITWPLAPQLHSAIPLGTEAVATVPLFNLWTLAWNVESLGRGYAGYWQAPIFHPAPDTFALSEPQPLTGLLAAGLSGLSSSILFAYNAILIAALAANGLLAATFLRVAGLGWLPTTTGGLLVLVLPFTHQELGVLQLVPLAGIFVFAIAVLRFGTTPGLRQGLFVGLGLAVAYGLSAQVAVFAVLAAAPTACWLWWPHRRTRRAWMGLVAGAVLFLTLASPMLLAQRRATAGGGFERSLESVRKQSARPSHYLRSAWPPFVQTPGIATAERPSARAFWPGTLRVLLAFGALVAAFRVEAWRRLAIAGALVLATSFLLSLGAHLRIGDLALLDALRAVPGLSQLRSFFRFALFAQLAVVGLAALALELLWRALRQRFPAALAGVLVAAVALAAVIELRPTMGQLQPLPPLELKLPWLTWVEEATAPDDVLAFVPFPEGRSSRAYLGTGQWMYWQMRHWRPMVNGYSGFFPAHFQALKKAMQRFPATSSLRALREAGVRYCIVHRTFMERAAAPDTDGPLRLVPIFQDEQHRLAIFELRNADLAMTAVEGGRTAPVPTRR